MTIDVTHTEEGDIAVGSAVENAKRVWADLKKIDDPELIDALKKIKTTKVVPQYLEAKLARRGTTPLAILQTANAGPQETESKTDTKKGDE